MMATRKRQKLPPTNEAPLWVFLNYHCVIKNLQNHVINRYILSKEPKFRDLKQIKIKKIKTLFFFWQFFVFRG